MKMNKLSIIAILAISFAFFSCNKEESLIIPQNSNNEFSDITEASIEQAKVISFDVVANPIKIGGWGGTSSLNGLITIKNPDGSVSSLVLSDMTYRGSAEGFTLRGNQIAAAPLQMHKPGRSIDITGKGTYEGKTYEGYITIHQEGTETAIAKINGIEYLEGDDPIVLEPGIYMCYAGYYGIGYAKETLVYFVKGSGVSVHQYQGTIQVRPGAKATIRLAGGLPGLPEINVDIISN